MIRRRRRRGCEGFEIGRRSLGSSRSLVATVLRCGSLVPVFGTVVVYDVECMSSRVCSFYLALLVDWSIFLPIIEAAVCDVHAGFSFSLMIETAIANWPSQWIVLIEEL